MLDGDALLKIYLAGHFPMWDPELEEVRLYQPDVRGVIDFDRFHVPRRLRDRMRSRPFRLSSDEAFEETFDQCHVERPDGTWMNPEMRRAYLELFERGFAHSIEAWKDDVLVGGLYGVHIGAAFMGESMFSRPELGGTDASKICLVENRPASQGRRLRSVRHPVSKSPLEAIQLRRGWCRGLCRPTRAGLRASLRVVKGGERRLLCARSWSYGDFLRNALSGFRAFRLSFMHGRSTSTHEPAANAIVAATASNWLANVPTMP